VKYRILKIIFLIWVALWVAFLIRELFVKNSVSDYAALLSRPLEGKHSYVTGDRLYDFIILCKKDIPEGATYKIVGVEAGSIEQRRITYYLYPRLESQDPDFIVDASKYELKKVKGQ